MAGLERQEWIVEAQLPARRVEYAYSRTQGRPAPVRVIQEEPGVREASLGELFEYLTGVLAVKPVMLRSAGAVGITASAEELERISSHPLVRKIAPNRRLRS